MAIKIGGSTVIDDERNITNIGNLAAASATFSGTGAITFPRGTTEQRPQEPLEGTLRFNTTTGTFEGFSASTWGAVGGGGPDALLTALLFSSPEGDQGPGATGGSSDEIFWENGKTVTVSYGITVNKNALSAGPITIATEAIVTIPTGSTWSVT